MKDIGSWRCQKKLLCILTTGRLMGVTVMLVMLTFSRLPVCAVNPSPTTLFDTNRFTVRNTLAVPIWAETCRMLNVRKPHKEASRNAYHHEGK